MTTYTIQVWNQTGASKSYVIFMPPSETPSKGGATPVFNNAWVTFENITNGEYDSASYTPETGGGKDSESPPAPRFLVAEGDYKPGQVIAQPAAPNLATIDFTGRSQTTAVATEHPDGAFTVAYA